MSRTSFRNIGIVGFGAFGRLIARELRPHCRVTAYDPGHEGGGRIEGVMLGCVEDLRGCDVVILAVPVSRLEAAIREISPHLGQGTLVADVCSVKCRPVEAMRDHLPPHVEILGTHPLFGPQSARDGIRGRKIALCAVRTASAGRVGAILRKVFGLKVIHTTPDAHDKEAALVQGLTHLIAKVLVRMEPFPRNMTTASFDHLMSAVDMVRYDAASVFDAIERENPFAGDVRERFFSLADGVRAELEG